MKTMIGAWSVAWRDRVLWLAIGAALGLVLWHNLRPGAYTVRSFRHELQFLRTGQEVPDSNQEIDDYYPVAFPAGNVYLRFRG